MEPLPKAISVQRIVLIGPMGVGKTTIGKLIAKQLDYKFLDTDLLLEQQTGASISLIFDIEGEEGFRKREREVIRELETLSRVVIATGGGSILSLENRKNLKKNSTTIYLRGRIDTLESRTKKDKNRPLLNTSDPKKSIERILNERIHLYEKTADFEIDIDDLSAEVIVSKIIILLS